MSTTLYQKAGYTLLLLLLLAGWAITAVLLVNLYVSLDALVNFMLEIARLG